jgi:hypothetical protein
VQFVGSRGKEQTRWLLTSKLEKIQENIESDCKLKKMAELQLTVVTDSKNKQVITEQVSVGNTVENEDCFLLMCK